jgi:hypothetical protein
MGATFLVCHGAWSAGWAWKLRIGGGKPSAPRSYIYATRAAPVDAFRPFAERAKSEPGWRYYEIDASHSPHVTAPEALMALLERIVSEKV